MLELAILGLLKEQDLHGYELKKRLAEALGPLSSVSFGSLYPALARLESAGAVEAVVTDDTTPWVAASPAVPMTGSITGEVAAFRNRRAASRKSGGRSSRGRKVYRVTDAGERLFEELLETDSTSGEDDRAFNLRLAFCRHLPPDARIGLFERRRAQLVERLAKTRSGRARKARIDSYTQSLIDHGTEATERDISWLDSLIATERKASRP
ncbi:MAG: PadR family transcriptional regulator [Actinomycetota bacterium]|nr:PadR family transcriptional regulator [Actinomycetota bacterium]